MLGKLSVPGRPTSLDDNRARAYCAYSRCGWRLFGHFFSHLSFLYYFSLSLGDGPIQTELLTQRAVKPKTTIVWQDNRVNSSQFRGVSTRVGIPNMPKMKTGHASQDIYLSK